jgi:hypothetical protein
MMYDAHDWLNCFMLQWHHPHIVFDWTE